MSIAIVVAVLTCAILGMVAFKAHAEVRMQRFNVDAVCEREEFVLDALRVLLDASRRSSDAVMKPWHK